MQFICLTKLIMKTLANGSVQLIQREAAVMNSWAITAPDECLEVAKSKTLKAWKSESDDFHSLTMHVFILEDIKSVCPFMEVLLGSILRQETTVAVSLKLVFKSWAIFWWVRSLFCV